MHAVRERIWAYGLSLGLLIAVGLPLLGWVGDSYPISNYPMFAGKRISPLVAVVHAQGVGSSGNTTALGPQALGTDEVMQAFETLRQALENEPDGPSALCHEIAQRVPKDEYVAVQIVTHVFDSFSYFEGDQEPRSSNLHAWCEVEARE